MKDVEFEEVDDHLNIPTRPKDVPQSDLAKVLVKTKLAPSRKYANYILIGVSVVCLAIALVFFALLPNMPK